ncbi:uncharacterized protein LOC100888536 isoform X8 [Strongylocentrotus purpuratus]|uniref:Uncharacterized protein n=1 Tax=Strongylocentrotus purpuratus TaxID=7668 RepID=A0A7M7PG53_STRPU|nr:uncharacterized protein LOC100888536 isoform X8 [Strongylocentrotus purpuratus]
MATKHACWTSASSTDGGEGPLQSSQEHDEGNISIKEEGEVGKETCLSIPGSKGLRYEGQLVTHDGLVFTIKQEVDTDMFESLSSTEGQDPSTEQEMVNSTIKQEDKEEIFEPITTQGEGGGETEQSIPEELDNGQDNKHPHITSCSGEKSHLCLHCIGQWTRQYTPTYNSMQWRGDPSVFTLQ